MKLITHPWFTWCFKAGGKQWQNYALQSGRLPTAQAHLLLSEWILTFYGILGLGFVFSSRDLTDPRLNLSSLCGQRRPWTSHPPVFSLWVLHIVWYYWDFFSTVIWEKAKFTESITTIRGIMPNGGCHVSNVYSGSLQKLCSEQGRRQWVINMLLPNTVQVAGQRDIADVSLNLDSKCWNKTGTNKWKAKQLRPKVCLTAVGRGMRHTHALILSLLLCSHALWRDSLPVWAYFDTCQVNELK